MSRRLRLLVACLGSLLLALLVALTSFPGTANAGPGVGADDSPAPVATPKAPAFTETKDLTRVFMNADGTSYKFPTKQVTVTASTIHDLRGRQRIKITWTGATPSGGRAANPFGESGMLQEYPVEILQCRGTDSTTVPAAKQVTPQTCFTTSVVERSQVVRSDDQAAWTHDLYATPADKQRISGATPFPSSTVCPTADTTPYFTHLTPFLAANGTSFPACDAQHMPPEAAVGAAFPANEIAAFSDQDGNGSVQFEVRSDVENASLGCNHDTPCTIEVIPINGLSCDAESSPPTISDEACRKGGQFAPGSSNFVNGGVDQAVAPTLWWSASNWRNRFSIPIDFGLPPDTCDLLDPRAPTPFDGSELLAQAALQWSPAYCLSKKRFKFQLNQLPEAAAWDQMQAGEAAAAEVASLHPAGTDPVGYAPTAVTGFAVGYIIDKPDNKGEFTDLRLNARLLAKLLTESYLGSDLGRKHPGIGDNPLGLMNDPEFQKLNPHLSETSQEAGAALLSLSTSSDLIEQLTDYIAHDKDAMAFIHGKPDPWGMRVNPSYKNFTMPSPQIPLLDTYIPQTDNACRQKNPAVYFSELAAPVTNLRQIAQALLDGWPNVQTRCDFDVASNSYKLGRIDRQSFGSRFMLGIVSLGDAARFGLRTAALETKPGVYVKPDEKSLAAAVGLMTQNDKLGPFDLSQADVRKSATAYPGTQIVYTAAKLRDLDKPTAAKVASFITISSTEGQKSGTGNGQLPEGFLPITDKGPTAKLFRSDVAVAAKVALQTPLKPTPTPTASPSGSASPTGHASPTASPTAQTSTPDAGAGGSGGGDTTPPVDVPPLPSSAPSSAAPPPVSAAPSPSATPTATVPPSTTTTASPPVVQRTTDVSSPWGARLLPTLLLLGLIGVAVSSGMRFFVQPPRRP